MEQRLQLYCEKELEDYQAVKDRIASIKVCQGYPAEEILLKTEALGCDAIVMGAHEKGFTHTFLGSVAKSVLRRSRRPTFIFPLPKGEAELSVHD
jgi:nucleotide-binding universal stress UspA family protein